MPQSSETPVAIETRTPEYASVSVAKYLYDNIHLLGFEKSTRVINTALREFIDNSQDECSRAGILPQIDVEICNIQPKTYSVRVKDNGPGIACQRVPPIVGSALYGSKFISSTASRGQQGLGIKGVNLYSLKTTGKPLTIYSKTLNEEDTTRFEISIDLDTNTPRILKEERVPASHFPGGSGFEITAHVRAQYIRNGPGSTFDLMKRYTYLNPTLQLRFKDPEGETIFPRLSTISRPEGIAIGKILSHQQIGELEEQLRNKRLSILEQLSNSYHGGIETFRSLLEEVQVDYHLIAGRVHRKELIKILNCSEKYYKKLPPPEGVLGTLKEGVMLAVTQNYQKHYDVAEEFRSQPVYHNRGVVQVEVCGFYGGDLPTESKIEVQRVANCSPLSYLTASCAITKAVSEFNWKPYALDHTPGELPRGPMLLLVHVTASKIPYTGPGKDAIAEDGVIVDLITEGLRRVGKAIKRYRHREQLKESRNQKLQVFTRTLPQIIRSISKSLDRPLIQDSAKLESIFAKLMDNLILIETDPKKYRVINGSSIDYNFTIGRLGVAPSEYRVFEVGANRTGVLEYDPVVEFFEGLNPEEYVMMDRTQWKKNIQGIQFQNN